MLSFKSSREESPTLFAPTELAEVTDSALESSPPKLRSAPREARQHAHARPVPAPAPSQRPKNEEKLPEKPQKHTISLTWKSWLLRFWVVTAAIWLTIYLGYRIHYINLHPALAAFSVLVCLAELHILLHLYGMFYSMWPRKYQTWPHLNKSRDLRINMFVCVCGEPPEVIKETIKSALETGRVYEQTISPFNKPRVIVLNDGKVAGKDNWEAVRDIALELGVEHIARDVKGGFKAGNINNGLKATPTPDPRNTLDIVFDSDFCAKPEFLVEITKPFVEEEIDFVQSPQRYKNEINWVAKAAAAHQIFFFDHICPAKGHDNALFLCGTNFAIRRSALDKVGGLEDKFITEDYATSLELHFAGCKGVFMPQVIALGMAPTSLKQYFTQQKRWAKGNFDVTGAYFKELFFGNLTFKQKMHYMLSATYYLIGLRDLILMLAPIPYLYFGHSLIKPNSLAFLFFVYAPLLVANFVMYLRMFRFPIKSLILDLVSFPIFTSAFLDAVSKKKLGFVVTIKKYEKERPLDVYRPQLLVCVTLFVGLIYSFLSGKFNGWGSFINYWWASFNVIMLALGFYLLVVENARWKVWEADGEGAPRPTFAAKFSASLGRLRSVIPFQATEIKTFAGKMPVGQSPQTKNPQIKARPIAPVGEPQNYTPQPLLEAPVWARSEVFRQIAVEATNKVVALTFDATLDSKLTPQILEALEREGAKATFYLAGRDVQAQPLLTRQIGIAGHDVGSCAWDATAPTRHPEVEVFRADKVIERTLGFAPTHFRPPLGEMQNGLAAEAMRQNHAIILWSCEGRGARDRDIIESVVEGVTPGGIIRLSETPATARALPALLRELRNRGYRFATVPQLLNSHGRTFSKHAV